MAMPRQDFRMGIWYFSTDRASKVVATPAGSNARMDEVISFFIAAPLRHASEQTLQMMAGMWLMPNDTSSLSESEWIAVLHKQTPLEKFQCFQRLKCLWKIEIRQALPVPPPYLRELPQDPEVLRQMRPDLYNALFMQSGMFGHCPWDHNRLEQRAKSVPMRYRLPHAMHGAVPAAVVGQMRQVLGDMVQYARLLGADRTSGTASQRSLNRWRD